MNKITLLLFVVFTSSTTLLGQDFCDQWKLVKETVTCHHYSPKTVDDAMSEVVFNLMMEAQKEYEENFYAFAKKHDIKIFEGKSELGKKMEISNAVFDYHNDLYLIFFKVHFNEGNLLEAIAAKDISAIRQNINAFKMAVQEGLEEVDKKPLYKKDDRIAKATKEVFQIHLDGANNTIPQILDYLVINEDFEKIKAAIEKTPESDRTKDQIVRYNTKVDELENKREIINKLIHKLFKKRNKKLERLDKVNIKFLDKHVPKYTI